MRHRPATGAALFVELFGLAFPSPETAGRWYGSDSAHQECRFYLYALQNPIRRIAFRNLCGCQCPNPLIERIRKKAAMPGQSARTRAHYPIPPGNSPSRIASCHQRHRNHRSTSVESSNVFAGPTLGQNVTRRNRKTLLACEQAVEDETSLWMAEENMGGIILP